MTIRDLAGRLKKIEVEAQAFAKLIEPNSEHAVIEHQIRAACGVLLNSLQHRISSASGLADLLVREQEAA
jgi:hypothetical protein